MRYYHAILQVRKWDEVMGPRSHASKWLNWNFNPGNSSPSVYPLTYHNKLFKYVKED